MSLFDRFFKEEQKPVAAIGADTPAQPVEVVSAPANTKLKLNFKRLPKKMVQAMADQTTGEKTDRKEEVGDTPIPRGSISEAFRAAAAVIGDDRDLRAALAEPPRPRAPMARPSMPRAPSFSP